ncbi:hypothetical protein [Halorientalis halophila]|uniref:hypothetical protein n=1 Tax=Halorientalis halophila TaxID=3108499 RepID=UPI00300BE644
MADPGAILDRSSEYPGEEFTNEDFEAVQDAIHGGRLGDVVDRPSALVLGSYDDAERQRLDEVRAGLDDHIEAVIMDEVLEVWTYWTSKFKLLVANSDLVVGVYEHSDGGHEWEAGYLDARPHREQTVVLRRNYPDVDAPEDEPFDAMLAHWIETMRYVDSVYDWTLEADDAPSLDDAVGAVVANHVDF